MTNKLLLCLKYSNKASETSRPHAACLSMTFHQAPPSSRSLTFYSGSDHCFREPSNRPTGPGRLRSKLNSNNPKIRNYDRACFAKQTDGKNNS
uniref:Uncharacterized protein n=1 Tax=Romanomermis culicivorax TaxID=13658 RepID=A0A915IYH4_ROMCU